MRLTIIFIINSPVKFTVNPVRDKFNINFDVPLAIDVEVGKSFGDGKPVQFIDGSPQNIPEILRGIVA